MDYLNEEIAKKNPRGIECHFFHTDGEVVAVFGHCSDEDVV